MTPQDIARAIQAIEIMALACERQAQAAEKQSEASVRSSLAAVEGWAAHATLEREIAEKTILNRLGVEK